MTTKKDEKDSKQHVKVLAEAPIFCKDNLSDKDCVTIEGNRTDNCSTSNQKYPGTPLKSK